MVRKRTSIMTTIVVLLLCFFGAIFLLRMNNTEQYVPEIEKQARISLEIPDSWEAVSETTNNIAAVLLYDNASNQHIFATYSNSHFVNAKEKFSLIAGGVLPTNQASIAKVSISGSNEVIFASMNPYRACILQITDEDKFSTIHIDPEKPFVIILSTIEGDVTFYDENDDVIAYDGFVV